MGRWTKVFAHEFTAQLRRPAFLILGLGLPIVMALLAVAYMHLSPSINLQVPNLFGDMGPKVVGYVDYSGMFPQPDPESPFGAVIVRYEDEGEARAAVESGEVSAYYVIPEDYLETGRVIRYSRDFDVIESATDMFSGFVISSLAGGSGVSPVYLARLGEPLEDVIVHRLDLIAPGEEQARVERDEDTMFAISYGFALVLMLGMFFTSNYLLRAVVEEKESRIVELLLSSVRPLSLLFGKILAMGALGLLQIVVWLGTAWLMFKLESDRIPSFIPTLLGFRIPAETVLIAVALYVLGYFFYSGLYAVVGTLTGSFREGSQTLAMVILPSIAPIYFLPAIVGDPHGGLAVALSLFPVTAPLGMVERVALTRVPMEQLVLCFALLALTAAGSVWLAARVFRVGVLLAGQQPKLRDLLRIVREKA